MAKNHGQLGEAKYLGQVDANTLTEPGLYYCFISNWEDFNVYDNHWPQDLGWYVPVRVTRTNNNGIIGIDQHIQSQRGNWSRTLSGRWKASYIFSENKATIDIYISKDGDNNNTGFVPDYPVQNQYRAIEIAEAIVSNTPNIVVNFCFGAGYWGNTTFSSLPFQFCIIPYDKSTPSEYSEYLPEFNNLSFVNCTCNIRGIFTQSLSVTQQSSVTLTFGYNRINYLYIGSNSYCYISCPTNNPLWELGQSTVDNKYTIFIDQCGTLWCGRNLNFRLYENVTNATFISVYCGSNLLLMLSSSTFDTNGFTYTGIKVYAYNGCSIYGNTKIFNNFFGQTQVLNNYLNNGISSGNVDKLGDTMTGTLYISDNNNVNSLVIKNPNLDKDNVTERSDKVIAFYDKNNKTLASIQCVTLSDATRRLDIIGWTSDTSKYACYFQMYANEKVIIIPTPPLSSAGGQDVTAEWVNSKLGSAKSVAMLTTLNEEIETPEIKQQKEIAELNSQAQQAIYQDFPFEVNGETYYFGYSLFDQQNLSDLAILSILYPDTKQKVPCQTDTGDKVFLELSPKEIQDIYKFAVENKFAILEEANQERVNILRS